jgi:hypothetical protein
MRAVSPGERRARLGIRHHLAAAARAATPAEAAAGVVALHATDPASVYLALAARCGPPQDPPAVTAIEHALYTERSLIRLLGMRRTMFVVPTGLAPVIQAASARAVAAAQRRRYERLLAEAGLGDGRWLRDVEDATVRALAARGEATGAQLAADEPRLRSQVLMAPGKPYAARQSITSWVLLLLAADGRIVRGRPAGSWLSSQWHWVPATDWLPGGLPELPPGPARVELARRWLAAFGPGTEADLRWWTGWTAGQARQALAAAGAAEVDLDGRTGLVLAGDDEPVPEPEPWVALLPALDPTAMGWSDRSWYLGAHAAALMDASGNIGPTVWCEGRVIGGWACRPGGEVVWRLLEDAGRDTAAAVAGQAAGLARWLDGTPVVPRFRTPLERELSR